MSWKRLRDRVKPNHHAGHGSHVARIYDEVLWRRLVRRAQQDNVFVGVLVTAACMAYLERDTPSSPGGVVGTGKVKLRMAKAGLRPHTEKVDADF